MGEYTIKHSIPKNEPESKKKQTVRRPSALRMPEIMLHCSATEPLGKSEGAKEAPSRSIKQFFKLFKFEKLGRQRGEKTFSTR